MIKIKTNNNHSKEKHYILSVIFSYILGLKTSYEMCDEHIYEITLPNDKQINPSLKNNSPFFDTIKQTLTHKRLQIYKHNFKTT